MAICHLRFHCSSQHVSESVQLYPHPGNFSYLGSQSRQTHCSTLSRCNLLHPDKTHIFYPCYPVHNTGWHPVPLCWGAISCTLMKHVSLILAHNTGRHTVLFGHGTNLPHPDKTVMLLTWLNGSLSYPGSQYRQTYCPTLSRFNLPHPNKTQVSHPGSPSRHTVPPCQGANLPRPYKTQLQIYLILIKHSYVSQPGSQSRQT